MAVRAAGRRGAGAPPFEASRGTGRHWPEYAIEAAGLASSLVVACTLGVWLVHPESAVVRALPNPLARRAVMGLAMGLTAIVLIYSPWGRRSGAHFNPATTLTFWRLGKIETGDAIGYVIGQAIGSLTGVVSAATVLGPALAHPRVRYVATMPGAAGATVAFGAEVVIAFVLMSVVLRVSNDAALARFTGLAAGALVAFYVTVEAPLSGMSLNPARSLGSAVPAHAWTAFWIYVAAPPLGMLAAAEVYVRRRGMDAVFCAKLHHDARPCLFRCRWRELRAAVASQSPSLVSQPQTAR
jgi:aquaporin Z